MPNKKDDDPKTKKKTEDKVKKDKPEQSSESTNPMEGWEPRTELGKKVKSGEITDIMQILNKGAVIMETEIVEYLVPDLESEYLLIESRPRKRPLRRNSKRDFLTA